MNYKPFSTLLTVKTHEPTPKTTTTTSSTSSSSSSQTSKTSSSTRPSSESSQTSTSPQAGLQFPAISLIYINNRGSGTNNNIKERKMNQSVPK